MFKANNVCQILCCLVALLSWQVSGTFHPLASVITSTTTVTKPSDHCIGSGRVQDFDPMVRRDSDKLVTSVLAIRGGGGVGSMVSDLNDYIGASKTRSWGVLVFSILTDTVAVTLMKTAQEESSVQKLGLSFVGFFLR
jgi:hypothetical protein